MENILKLSILTTETAFRGVCSCSLLEEPRLDAYNKRYLFRKKGIPNKYG